MEHVEPLEFLKVVVRRVALAATEHELKSVDDSIVVARDLSKLLLDYIKGSADEVTGTVDKPDKKVKNELDATAKKQQEQKIAAERKKR